MYIFLQWIPSNFCKTVQKLCFCKNSQLLVGLFEDLTKFLHGTLRRACCGGSDNFLLPYLSRRILAEKALIRCCRRTIIFTSGTQIWLPLIYWKWTKETYWWSVQGTRIQVPLKADWSTNFFSDKNTQNV